MLVLRRDDLKAFAAHGDRSSFATTLVERRHEVRRHLRLRAPDFLGVAPPSAPAPESTPDEEPLGEAGRYTGVGIGRTAVVGVARRVPDLGDPELLDRLGADDVLVLPHAQAFHYADWHSILTLVRGVVSPGQPSHHLAQVARECGVPVIGQVEGNLSLIPDGARLQLDPGAGVVRVLDDGGGSTGTD